MPLGTSDLTRIIKYKAFTLGSNAGGPLTYNSLLTLIQQQINNINATDAELGTTFADEIQADLNTLDSLDSNTTTGVSSDGIKILGIGSGIEYFEGGATKGFTTEMNRLRSRVARILSQSYSDSDGVSYAYRG